VLDEEDSWLIRTSVGSRAIPFFARDGLYWGMPSDEEMAIRELIMLSQSGVSLMVPFGWPVFWCLDFYDELHRYLRSRFRWGKKELNY
jgi:hypothetical protein